ncbi:hypothetical protein ACTXT7_012115 [Hymenolepis weldensis]
MREGESEKDSVKSAAEVGAVRGWCRRKWKQARARGILIRGVSHPSELSDAVDFPPLSVLLGERKEKVKKGKKKAGSLLVEGEVCYGSGFENRACQACQLVLGTRSLIEQQAFYFPPLGPEQLQPYIL